MKVIYATPVEELVASLRKDAQMLRSYLGGKDSHAHLIDTIRERLEEAIQRGANMEWVDAAVVAELEEITQSAIAARCRRTLAKQGLARKVHGTWFIHASVLQPAPAGGAVQG